MKYTLLFFLCLVTFFNSFSQKPADKITVQSLNEKYLEHLIKIKIDSVRTNLGLSALINDSILYTAAQHHAHYLNIKNVFSHKESDSLNYVTPQDRVDSYGGVNYFVGENIIKSYINKPISSSQKKKSYSNSSYQDIANDFVVGWVNSPGHYANIITTKYNLTGLAISIKSERNQVYAVQKFAFLPFVYQFEENEKMFAFSNYVPPAPINSFEVLTPPTENMVYSWKIKPIKDSVKLCSYCNVLVNKNPYKDLLKQKGRFIFYKTYNVELIEEILKTKKSGLAIELVEYDPYECGNPNYYSLPSRRNKWSILNGEVLKPKLNKELVKGLIGDQSKGLLNRRVKETAKYFKKTLGRFNDESQGLIEINILVLKKRQVCRVMHFSDFCGEQLFSSYPSNLKVVLDTFDFKTPIVLDTFYFQVPFKKNKATYSYQDILPLISALENKKFIIHKAKIEAFSSVEGSAVVNAKLQKERAESILYIFQKMQADTIESEVEVFANWDLMFNQIGESSQLDSLKNMDQREIETLLRDKQFCLSIEDSLAKQRVGNVTFFIQYLPDPEEEVKQLLSQIKNRRAKENLGVEDWDTIRQNMFKIYQLVKEEKCDKSNIIELEKILDSGQKSIILKNEYLIWLKYDLGYFSEPRRNTAFLNELSRILFPSYEAQHNKINISLAILAEDLYTKEVRIDSVLSGIDYLRLVAPEGIEKQIDSLELHCLITTLNYYAKEDPSSNEMKQLNKYSVRLKNLALKMALNEMELFRIAKHLVFVESDIPAFSILDYLMVQQTKNQDVIALHAKMLYIHHQEYQSTAYHEYLMELEKEMDQKKWCSMFVGPCNISFQVFDYKPLRDLYCESCAEYKNYGNSPELWEK